MGKTEKGAVWLDEKLFSVYDYWQFWRNTNDNDVIKFLRYFTEIQTEEIENLEKKEKNINNLKILLANETTKILYGKEASLSAESTAKETFELGGLGINLPEIKVKKNALIKGINILDFLVDNKIMSSKSESRRAIKNNALKIDNQIIIDDKKNIELKDFKNKNIKLSFGKKKHYLIKII